MATKPYTSYKRPGRLTASHVAIIGRTLYGANWQTAMASRLGYSSRSIRRWGNGEVMLPFGIQHTLVTLMNEHLVEVQKLLNDTQKLSEW